MTKKFALILIFFSQVSEDFKQIHGPVLDNDLQTPLQKEPMLRVFLSYVSDDFKTKIEIVKKRIKFCHKIFLEFKNIFEHTFRTILRRKK